MIRVLPLILLGIISCNNSPTVISDSGMADQAVGPDRGADAAWLDAAPDIRMPDLEFIPQSPLEGIYEITGTYDEWGDYTGKVEIRQTDDGYKVYHTTNFEALFEGDRVATAWEGTILADHEPYYVEVILDRVGFITQYETWSREGVDSEPARYFSDMRRVAPQVLTGAFAPTVGSGTGSPRPGPGSAITDQRRSGATNARSWPLMTP